jgi:hypothetical protein
MSEPVVCATEHVLTKYYVHRWVSDMLNKQSIAVLHKLRGLEQRFVFSITKTLQGIVGDHSDEDVLVAGAIRSMHDLRLLAVLIEDRESCSPESPGRPGHFVRTIEFDLLCKGYS